MYVCKSLYTLPDVGGDVEAVTKVLTDADVMMMSKIHDRWRLSLGEFGQKRSLGSVGCGGQKAKSWNRI